MVTFSALTVVVIALIAILVALGLLWAYLVANRLDRLHVRSDLSWQALDAALARRAVVARAVGDALKDEQLIKLAAKAERAERDRREYAENQLAAALSTVDPDRLRPALVAELADAETRVLIARRFHNDAVRDTLALRVRRPVRWLRLGGTAPMPTYFEIIDRPGAGTEDPALANFRTSARIILLDEDGRVLLLRGFDPAAPTPAVHWWFTVGGQTLPGEKLADGAVRELVEETGLSVPSGRLVGPLWRRVAVFDFNGTTIRSEELFFVHRTKRFEPATDGRTNLEQRYITGHRWCDAEEIAALTASGEQVYPNQLGELLCEAAAAADAVAPGARRAPVQIG